MSKENENFEIVFSPEIQSLSYFAHIPYTPMSAIAEFVVVAMEFDTPGQN